jgi:hypothetical protein
MVLSETKKSSIDPPATGNVPTFKEQIGSHVAATDTTITDTATANDSDQSRNSRFKSDVQSVPSYKDQMRVGQIRIPSTIPLAEATPLPGSHQGSRLELEERNLELQQELERQQQELERQQQELEHQQQRSLIKTKRIRIAVGMALILVAAVTVAGICASGNCGRTLQQPLTPAPTVAERNDFLYPQSIIVPNKTVNFDHLQDFGYSPNNFSRMDKISQIQVFRTNVCLDGDTCKSTRLVLSLVITYFLCDGQVKVKTQGAYTGSDQTPLGTINFRSDTYITRIELSADETYLIGMTICTLNEGCFGPYGDSPELQANMTIFEMSNSTIKAFYGLSGSWVDALGVYYELVGFACS